jgi:hypothetical protein
VNVSTYRNSGKTYDELMVREFRFSPYGLTFGEETRSVDTSKRHSRTSPNDSWARIQFRSCGDTRAS